MALPIKLQLPEGFLNQEIRSGYEVTSKLKKIWAVELDLIAELKRVCDKHGIKFMLAYGTLLGAVRHKGFIPWDDDFDIWIRRDDFEKLVALGESEFQYPYFLQHALNEGDEHYMLPYARLRNSETTGAVGKNPSPEVNQGIYVDIYVIDGYPGNSFLFNVQTRVRNLLAKMCVWRRRRTPFFGLQYLVQLLSFEKWYALYRWCLSYFNKSALRWGPRYRNHPKAWNWWIEKSAFDDLVEMPYENLMLPCPRNYDAHLSRMYGDYMSFPAASERGKWHEGIVHFEPEIPYKVYLSR